MPHANVNGLDLYHELHGDGGDPLVLVHGYTGDITDWRHQVPAFAESHRVLVIDNRGHGRSEAPSDRSAYTVDQMASDVQELTRSLGFERFHLLGHSMGGAVAQEIALETPERLLSLTLHDTSDDFGRQGMSANMAAWSDYRIRVAEEQGMRALAETTPSTASPPHMPPGRASEMQERLARMSVDAFVGAWEGLSSWQGTKERAHRIETPTLVVWGDLDAELIIRGSQRLAQNIPNAEPAVVPETGHSPQYERPELFNAALGTFLSRASASVRPT